MLSGAFVDVDTLQKLRLWIPNLLGMPQEVRLGHAASWVLTPWWWQHEAHAHPCQKSLGFRPGSPTPQL